MLKKFISLRGYLAGLLFFVFAGILPSNIRVFLSLLVLPCILSYCLKLYLKTRMRFIFIFNICIFLFSIYFVYYYLSEQEKLIQPFYFVPMIIIIFITMRWMERKRNPGKMRQLDDFYANSSIIEKVLLKNL